mmetsp:Transcript_74029/g.240745  ORF Transcript_74029/g.240745 Transcript_74029/m.240745 type:complete len:159 (+) Transcript_74029:46-522(+)
MALGVVASGCIGVAIVTFWAMLAKVLILPTARLYLAEVCTTAGAGAAHNSGSVGGAADSRVDGVSTRYLLRAAVGWYFGSRPSEDDSPNKTTPASTAAWLAAFAGPAGFSCADRPRTCEAQALAFSALVVLGLVHVPAPARCLAAAGKEPWDVRRRPR